MMQLRPATRDDFGYLVALARDPEIEPYLAPGGGSQERLEEMLEERARVGEPFGMFIVEADRGETVGAVALREASARSGICNLRQLMVDPTARRRGVGTEAVRLACHRALVEYGAHRVQSESFGDNHAAHRVFERVGFVREGVRRLAYLRDGEWVDGVLHGILAGELR
jgi:RimJ/RimL family protein N-acetyltransferase